MLRRHRAVQRSLADQLRFVRGVRRGDEQCGGKELFVAKIDAERRLKHPRLVLPVPMQRIERIFFELRAQVCPLSIGKLHRRE